MAQRQMVLEHMRAVLLLQCTMAAVHLVNTWAALPLCTMAAAAADLQRVVHESSTLRLDILIRARDAVAEAATQTLSTPDRRHYKTAGRASSSPTISSRRT